MFANCNLLTSLNLSNFNTKNATNIEDMFAGCKFLKKHHIITNDKNILKLL